MHDMSHARKPVYNKCVENHRKYSYIRNSLIVIVNFIMLGDHHGRLFYSKLHVFISERS